MQIQILQGDVTRQPDAQAIVNSANANLRFGSGVAGAIHTAAGIELERHCRPLAPLAPGAAILTPGFDLPNPWVILLRAAHYLDDDAAPHILESALGATLDIARARSITSLALPAVGTGVFRFPPALAAAITARALLGHAAAGTSLQWVRICVGSSQLLHFYKEACDTNNEPPRVSRRPVGLSQADMACCSRLR